MWSLPTSLARGQVATLASKAANIHFLPHSHKFQATTQPSFLSHESPVMNPLLLAQQIDQLSYIAISRLNFSKSCNGFTTVCANSWCSQCFSKLGDRIAEHFEGMTNVVVSDGVHRLGAQRGDLTPDENWRALLVGLQDIHSPVPLSVLDHLTKSPRQLFLRFLEPDCSV